MELKLPIISSMNSNFLNFYVHTYSSVHTLSPRWKITGLPSGLIATAVIWPTRKALAGQLFISFGRGGLSSSLVATRAECFKSNSSTLHFWNTSAKKQYLIFRLVIIFAGDQLMNIVVKMLVYLLSIFGLAADITVLNRNEQQTIQKFEHCSYGLVTVFFFSERPSKNSSRKIK